MTEQTKLIDKTGQWVLFATISAASMAFIGGSALNVALPALQEDLGASGADLLWILNSFALLLAALLLVGGSLGDHFGRKRIYMIGIVIFAGSSFVCGIAPNSSILIAARAVQGIGGALMVPGSLAIVSAYFNDEVRGKAIGIWSSFTTLTSIAGPLLGGFLASAGLWRGIFFINIPLALVSLYALWRYVPESRDETAPKELDFLGAALVTIGLAGLTYSFIELGRLGIETGMSQPLVPGSLIVGIAGLIAFVFVEARSDHPMMPLGLFKSRTFTGTNLLTLFLYGALAGALFFFPLNLVQIQNYDELAAGFAMMPMMVILVVLSPTAGGWVEKYGPRPPLIIGPTLVGIGFFMLALPGIVGNSFNAYLTSYLPGIILQGLGMGITVAPLVTAVMGSVPQHNAGIASGVNNAMSRSSQVLANAIMGGIALVFFASLLSTLALDTPDLTAEQQTQLVEEAQNFGNAAVPDGLDAETAELLQTEVNWAFVQTFRWMMGIAGVLCWASALMAAFMVEKRLYADKPKEQKAELQDALS